MQVLVVISVSDSLVSLVNIFHSKPLVGTVPVIAPIHDFDRKTFVRISSFFHYVDKCSEGFEVAFEIAEGWVEDGDIESGARAREGEQVRLLTMGW